MSKRSFFSFILLSMIISILLENPATAVNPEKRILNIQLQAIHKDTPGFFRSEELTFGNYYLIRMVKIRDNPQFKSLPETEANVLYYGEVKLGSPIRTHGILIDFEGKDKLFWVDSDADNNYAEEPGYLIFKSDRVPGVNFYYSPTPISFQVAYEFEGHCFKSLIQFNMPFLAVARTGYQDLFYLTTRTWFAGNINTGENDLRVSLVDTNDNGIYSDSDDLLFIDRDYDLNFTLKESSILAKAKAIKIGAKRWNVSTEFLPKKLILTER